MIAFLGLGHMGGPMSANLVAAGHTVRVEVEDTGVGMSGEAQRHVFDRFYRGRDRDPCRSTFLAAARGRLRSDGISVGHLLHHLSDH